MPNLIVALARISNISYDNPYKAFISSRSLEPFLVERPISTSHHSERHRQRTAMTTNLIIRNFYLFIVFEWFFFFFLNNI